MIQTALLSALFLLATGMGGAVFARHPRATTAVYGASLAFSLTGLGAALGGLAGEGGAVVLPLGLPGLGMHFALDPLASVFLAIVTLGGAASSLYALGYGRHAKAPERVLPFFPAFLAAMMLVVLAADAYSFLLSWEAMSLASWALVVSDHKPEENRRAGLLYLLMAGFGTLCLFFAFGLLAGPAGSYAFAAMRAAPHGALAGALVLVLALLGAGSKAGLVPLHVWLPRAHPAAPGHVSALMSGVMTKVAIYAFIRIAFDLVGPAGWWWGLPVLLAGGASAVYGVLAALLEDDIKTVLACSTIENVGIIFVSIGLALAFRADGMGAAAALALTAALFHALNHALAKSALFFGAGAVDHATGTRSLGQLGGLIHRMPVSAIPILIAAMAIAALPPLNLFASEWLTLQAILLSPTLPQWALKLTVPAVGALLALAAALAAACFVRFFGMGWLGRPRSEAAARASETDGFSRGAMIGLAALCVLAGALPGPFLDMLSPAVHSLLGASLARQSFLPWGEIVPVSVARSSYDPVLILVFVLGSAGLAVLALHRFASRVIRRDRVWGCGFADTEPGDDAVFQYAPAGFAQPIRRVFGSLVFRARETVDMPEPGDISAAHFTERHGDLAWPLIYTPIATVIARIADRANVLQFLTIRRYLALVFATLVALLIWIAAA